ncbi:hypothetical protein NDU88_010001 [Pleurodeles waltl]|uniref:Secreted protein n=1 Tax=Pleurodeles waltl TaxID=8319 RepID=A0AAV7PWQ0_PLEWA|nr:hypothetical protein NDU88_010001 [Pleurodeles waltl]
MPLEVVRPWVVAAASACGQRLHTKTTNVGAEEPHRVSRHTRGSFRVGPCLQTGTDTERCLHSGNQTAAAGPRQRHEAPTAATAPQEEEGGGRGERRRLQCVHSPAAKQTPARSSRRAEHRGECRNEALRLWGAAQ